MLVSVVIPTYNYAHFIGNAIHAVLSQDYPNELIEIIVYDDGSSDDTKSVVEKFMQQANVQYYWQENRGKADATYKAIQKAKGKYIFNLDADDYYLPGKIKRTVEIFEADETIVHVASQAKQVYEQQGKITFENFGSALVNKKTEGVVLMNHFFRNNIFFGGGSTYAARASVLKQIVIPPAVDMYIDEFLVYSILPFGKSFLIEDYLSVWRGHGKNYSGIETSKDVIEKKQQRLMNSSKAMLQYLCDNNFDAPIIKLYRLKHETRLISFKEARGEKKFNTTVHYFFQTIFVIKPPFYALKKYKFYNRLIPGSLLEFFKKIFKPG